MIESILLIDDSEPDNFLHEYLLKKSGKFNEILSVLNVERALELLKKRTNENKKLPKIIMVDINMPRLNGWEFLDILFEDQSMDLSETHLYMLTTSLNPDDKEKALNEYKLTDFYNKPLTLTHIEEVISRME